MASIKKQEQTKRIYSNENEVDLDTFKLKVAHFLKNPAPWIKNAKHIEWQKMEHSHIFHTFDSQGRKMAKACMTGGHTHSVKVTEVDGEFELEIGPAMTEKGEFLPHDSHTHGWEYLKSDKIKIQSMNQDAAKYVMQKMNVYAKAD